MKLWRAFFAFAAAFNFVAGAALLFAGAQAMPALSGGAGVYMLNLVGWMLIVFGLGYAMVAWRPLPNRNLVVLGALVKSGAAVLAAWHSHLGNVEHTTLVMGMVDLAFALVFAIFLHQTRKATV